MKNYDKTKPTLIMLAGVNGAGKSTIYEEYIPKEPPFINSDLIARNLSPYNFNNNVVTIRAARIALKQIDNHIKNKETFVFETTLSSKQSVALISRAIESGFDIDFHFVGLDDPALNKVRVKSRVEAGGHHIPTEVIERRHKTTNDNLKNVLPKLTNICLYDNSGTTSDLLLQVKNKKINYQAKNIPQWAIPIVRQIQENNKDKTIEHIFVKAPDMGM